MKTILMQQKSLETVQNGILWAPLRMLEADHHVLLAQIRTLRGIFQRWQRGHSPVSWNRDDKERVKNWLVEHRQHLEPHFRAEEETIFPYLTGHRPRLRPALAKLQREHAEIRRRSLALERGFRRPNASFCGDALVLLRLIERHVTEEQRLMEPSTFH